jgi:2-oxoglutarate ferredoxin oxidoreductase subunit alpha
MADTQTKTRELMNTDQKKIVNDFSITVGTENGSGSQTSNLTILRALFKMGIPVSGKNIFPSNIQGLPTWYTIRVNQDGFLARRDEHEIVVAMNPASFSKDLADVAPGGSLFYADDINLLIDREDISIYPMPVKEMVKESDAPSNLRNYVANMVYVGILAQNLGIDLDMIYMALDFHFKGKPKPIDLNFNMIKSAYDWADTNLEKNDPYLVEPLGTTNDWIMTDGNTAAALGSIYGGVQFTSWYPITPASSLAEALNQYLPLLRKDPIQPDKNTFAVVQAEDELAAIGMAIGAGWGGLRAMTSTSGPGISLMAEYAGLAHFAEIPVVIWNVQRAGPSTGLPTRTAQCDLTFTYFLGHGDTKHVILLPGSINECFEFGWKSFDIAERLQTIIFVLSDLDFGMNQWIASPFEYPDTPMDRGKVLWEEDIEKLNGNWGRYRDVDGDGIPYRTIPGNRHPGAAFFTRGTGHTDEARYSEDAEVYEKLLERLSRKNEIAREILPGPVIDSRAGANIGIIAFGSSDAAVQEARFLLDQEEIATDYMRIRAIPFSRDVREFIAGHERNYVVELNRDGQMHQLLTLDFLEHATKLIPAQHLDGMPLTAKQVLTKIKTEEANYS